MPPKKVTSPTKTTSTNQTVKASETSSPKKTLDLTYLNGDSEQSRVGQPKVPDNTTIPREEDDAANMSQFIQQCSSSANDLVGSNAGAPRRQPVNRSSPIKYRSNSPSKLRVVSATSFTERFAVNKGALNEIWGGLSATEQTKLLELYEFITSTLPSLFSRIQQEGNSVFHEAIRLNQLFVRSFKLFERVHARDELICNLVAYALSWLEDLGEHLSVHSVLPGLGRILVSILKKDQVSFLVGPNQQELAISVLQGSQDSAKFAYLSSGKQLASWINRGNNRKHGGRGGNRGGRGGGRGGKRSYGEYNKQGDNGQFAKQSKKPTFVKD